MRKKVELYTDGACSGNPGAGGWGAILIYKGKEKEFSGAENDTTNNRMELTAIIQGLKKLKEPCDVDVYSDSQYAVGAFQNGWIDDWRTNGWRKSDKSQVKNVDLWEELIELMCTHRVRYYKVKGHSDNPLNNRCDKLATDAIKKLK